MPSAGPTQLRCWCQRRGRWTWPFFLWGYFFCLFFDEFLTDSTMITHMKPTTIWYLFGTFFSNHQTSKLKSKAFFFLVVLHESWQRPMAFSEPGLLVPMDQHTGLNGWSREPLDWWNMFLVNQELRETLNNPFFWWNRSEKWHTFGPVILFPANFEKIWKMIYFQKNMSKKNKQKTHWQQVLLIVVMTPLLFFLGTFLFIWSCFHCDPTSLVFRLAGVQSSKEASTQITRNFNKFVVSRCHLTTIWVVNDFPFMVERSGWSPYQNISVKIGFEFYCQLKFQIY